VGREADPPSGVFEAHKDPEREKIFGEWSEATEINGNLFYYPQ
jgi:hypothetical protein